MLEKERGHILITEDIEIYSNDSDDSDDSDKKTQLRTIKYINLFLKETRMIKENKKNIRSFSKLGTLKFLPDIQKKIKLGVEKFHFLKSRSFFGASVS